MLIIALVGISRRLNMYVYQSVVIGESNATIKRALSFLAPGDSIILYSIYNIMLICTI